MDFINFLIISQNLLFFFCELSHASDTISSSQALSDGKTLVSKGGTFELGFFSPGSSNKSYIGIWYRNIPVKTVVWVANRLAPVNGSLGPLMINSSGNLVLMSQNTSIVWSTNLRTDIRSPVVAQLLDSGNFVLRYKQDGNSGTYLWQSFDYPSDTLLPGMKLGWNLEIRFEWFLTAWRSPDDPSPGDFTWRVQVQDCPELVMWKGSQKFYRGGPWNGLGFGGAPQRSNQFSQYNLVSNDKELYFTYNNTNKSEISMIVMNQTNYLRQRLTWNEETQIWKVILYLPRDQCDTYGFCGANGYCITSDFASCQCLKGFKHKSPQSMDSSQGCVRNKPLNYSKHDGFIKFAELRLPDTTNSYMNRSLDIRQCREKCLENSSCTAYANSDIRGRGSGCIIWFGDLIDMRHFSSGQELYIRMSASELGSNHESKKLIVVILVNAIAVFAGGLLISFCCCIHKIRRDAKDTIANATNNFAINNKLGEGGFGPVYKGKLADGQEIAVKRLSTISGQGIKELKNEVILIAKLQHRNLVKLLGCCIQGDEKLLIYEFMPNKSLDYVIFDKTRRKILDWPKRFNIICGIARGLLYLHQDSRLRIIHRDLKASNILLDHEMNPKISDFGLAKTFGGDEIEGSTRRVVGTYGYMAPEYAIDGLFSVKSDVFSFGILMLEIISGKKNKGFCHTDESLNIAGHAWKLWKEGNPLQLLDPYIGETSNLSVVMRCMHISLLCLQQHPEDRPSMSSVVLMLCSENVLPQPKQPGFLLETKLVERGYLSSNQASSSTNEITISELEGR